MQTLWSLQDAKNKFSQVVDSALQGTAQVVTRRGVPAVVVVAFDQYQSLAQKQKVDNGFAQFLLTMPKEVENTVADELEPARGRCDLELREVEF